MFSPFPIEGKDGEIIDPSIEGVTRCVTKVSKVQSVEKECSVASSEVTDTGLGGMEVQSPRFFMRGNLSCETFHSVGFFPALPLSLLCFSNSR